MNIKPLNDRVAVEILPPPEETKGGILIPGIIRDSRDMMFRAKVIAVGPGRRVKHKTTTWRHVPLTVKVGDVVYITRREGYTTLRDRDPEIRLYREDQLLGVERPAMQTADEIAAEPDSFDAMRGVR